MLRNLGALALFVLAFAAPQLASAQSYNSSGFAQVAAPALTPVPVSGSPTFTAACTTPATPASCPPGSSVVYSLAAGAADFSVQLVTPNGIVLATRVGNDGLNFLPANVTLAGSSPSAVTALTSFSAAGKYNGLGGSSAYLAIVATTAPTASTTITPYLSAHSAGINIHGSVPLTILNQAVDTSNRIITAPSGIGADTVAPTPISSTGTLLDTPPIGAKGVEIDVPPGASVSEYIAPTVAGSSSAAVPVSHTFSNPSSATTPLAVQLNLASAQLVWITNIVAGTASPYVSGLPTFRWI